MINMFLFFFFFIFLIKASLRQASISPVTHRIAFSYNSFKPKSCSDGTLICMGSVNGGDGYLRLSQEPEAGNDSSSLLTDQIGRVLFHQPVIAWPAFFNTTFTVRIFTFPNSSESGDGMAFIMAENNLSSPPNSFGSYLGIMDKSTQGGIVRQIALELDTYANEFDPDGNHIGIDTSSIISPVTAKSLNTTNIDLKSGRDIVVRVDYDSRTMQLQVFVAYAGYPLVSFLNQSIDMSATVPKYVFVGFTAATGPYSEAHRVLNWAFQSTPLPDIRHVSVQDGERNRILIAIILGTGVLIVGIVSFPLVRRAMRRRKESIKKRVDIESRSRTAANVPKIFTYKQLSKATRKFSKENFLGTGAFGSVYKGVISWDPPTAIAVKKISSTSKQGEKEYLAEICTIGRLRHKNIVQLQGWCHEGNHLLLVYEYMSNGSLDRYIGKCSLDWKTRYKILTGLASALLYLHEECGNPIVHRDVKPNNVMLDSDFNAHLGDFGLARLLQNDSAVTTMLAGTPGYLAPEVGYTRKVTPECDVYSFGMVVLEVVLGRRSKGFFEENSLVDYVWNLHGKNALLDGVDKMIEGIYDEEQVKRALIVGLACLHPDFTFRPKIRKVQQIFLNPDEPPMELPESRPNSVCVRLFSSGTTSTTTDMGSKSVNVNTLLQSSISGLEEMVLHEIVALPEQ